MRRGIDDTPERLHYALCWALFGLFLIAVLWSLAQARVVRHLDVRPYGLTDRSLTFQSVQIARKGGALLTLTARQDPAGIEAMRWPLPDSILLDRMESIRLIDLVGRRVLDEVVVAGTSFRSARYEYELGTELSLFAAATYFFGLPLAAMLVVLLLSFALFAWLSPSRDSWWFMRWWFPHRR